MKQKTIKIGSQWVIMARYRSPWDGEPRTVKILDVKDGWVRYEMGEGLSRSDNRKRIDAFLNLYELADGDWLEEIEA